MLIICALRFLAQAHTALETGPEDPRRIETIPRDLQKAQNLIAELQGAIDHEAGSKVATNLDQLYDYFNRRLLEANLKKDLARVIEIERLLQELRDAWAEMLPRAEGDAPPAAVSMRSVA